MQKTILITGANRGIGLELARQLGRKGHQVVLTARDRVLGEMAQEKLQKEGISVLFLELDVTDQYSINHAVTEVKKKFQKLDVLINNAGIAFDDEEDTLLTVKQSALMQTFKVNTVGPLLITQAFLPLIPEREISLIINISSVMGSLATMSEAGNSSYRISKTALNVVTKMYSIVLKDKHISVTSVHPGWVQTRMGGKEAPITPEEAVLDIVWLVEVHNPPNGVFLYKRKEISW